MPPKRTKKSTKKRNLMERYRKRGLPTKEQEENISTLAELPDVEQLLAPSAPTKEQEENISTLKELPDAEQLLAPQALVASPLRFYCAKPMSSPFRILDLPGEVRNRIYEKLLEGYAKISACLSPCFRDHGSSKQFEVHSDFMSGSRQIYQEYGSFFYGLEVWFHDLREAKAVLARGLPQAPFVRFLRKVNLTRTDSLYHCRDCSPFQTLAGFFESFTEAENLQSIALSHIDVCDVFQANGTNRLRFLTALLPFLRHVISKTLEDEQGMHSVLEIIRIRYARDCCCYIKEGGNGCFCGYPLCDEIYRLGVGLVEHERSFEGVVREALVKALIDYPAKSMQHNVDDETQLQEDLAFAATMTRLRGPRPR